MKNEMSKSKLALVVPIVLLLFYAIFYMALFISGQLFEHHNLFLLTILFFITFSFLVFGISQKSRLIQTGSVVMLLITVIEFFIGVVGRLDEFIVMHPLLDALIHIGHIIGLAILSMGLYFVMRATKERHMLFQLFFTYNNAVYFDYDLKSQLWTFIFSKSFRELHHISTERLLCTTQELTNYFHEEDRHMIENFSIEAAKESSFEARIRLKFPEMTEYTWIYSKVASISEQKMIGIDIDVSHLQDLITQLDESKEALDKKEYEERAILENTNDIIVKFSKEGKIVFATENYARFFNYTKDELMKMSVENQEEIIGLSKDEWFLDVMKHGYSESIVEWNVEGTQKWIFWKNRLLKNEDDEIESILSVGHDITDLKRLNSELFQKSLRDDLTGFYNRIGLFQQISVIENKPSAILFYLDLENYSYINDYYGHDVGDQVIKEVANELEWFVQKGALVGRLAGDEFVIVVTNPQIIQESLRNIYRFLEASYSVSGVSVTVKKNIGYAIYPDDSPTIKGLVSLASLAMLESKSRMTLTAVRFVPEFQMSLKENLTMASAIKHAMETNEIDVHFQAILNTLTGETIALEALARWRRQDDSNISPLVLFQHATKSKMVQDLDRFLIDKALRYFKILRNQPAYSKASITINVAPATLLEAKFIDFLKYELAKYAIDSSLIVLEVAETTFVGNLEHCFQQIRRVRSLGIKIAIDDFGRDYSSLSVLTAIDFDMIKIDRVFVDRIHLAINMDIVQMIIKIAASNKKMVIAEGVETIEQSSALMKLDCIYQQGFLFARPKKLV
jgi:diguanylate cyclase (GGDEF)-like protein/PAS domain S-box-containing protein